MPLLYKEIKQAMIEMAARSKPHSRLPSRMKLCDQFQVTRTTVDRAVEELIREGYLYSLNGSGTYVADHATNVLALPHEGLSVAVLLPNIMHDTYPGILRGIEDTMQAYGVNVTLCNTDNDFDKQESYILRLIRSQVSGVIIIPAVDGDTSGNERLNALLERPELPVVFCNRRVPGLQKPLVTSNDYYGGLIAVRHLLERGCRRVAFLASEPYQVTNARYQGYQAAHWIAGLEPEKALTVIVDASNCPETGSEGMRQLLPLAPDGVFCFNDRLAVGAMDAMMEEGVRCGEDIALVGYDDTSVCEAVYPHLTSVSYEEYENGRRAAAMLMEIMTKPERFQPYLTVTRPELHIRGSSERFRGAEPMRNYGAQP